MSTARVVLGFAGALTVAAGWAVAGVAAARHAAGDLPAPLRQATAAVLALAGALLSAALLGSFGLLRAWALVAVAVGAGAVGAVRLRRHPVTRSARAAPTDRRDMLLLCGAGALVAVRWLAEVVQTMDRGFSHADELHYHLTHSALFVQSQQTWPIRFTSVGDGSAYHPAHSELLHAMGIAVLGSDFLSIFVNLGFGVLALAAGWAIGGHAGNRAAGALIVAASLSLPLVVAESGSALNDTMAISLLLVSVALLLEAWARDRGARLHALAGVAAGLAVGTKLTVLVAVAGLLLAVVAPARVGRWSRAAAFTGSALVAGGYWYLRNLAHTGNPVPALSFGPLPGPELELQRRVEFPLLDYATDLGVWREWFVPGLARFAGPLWPGAVALVALGAVAGLASWRRDRHWALLAGVGLLSLLGYAATPTSAAGGPGAPALFEFNLRYAVPGALLCALAGLAHPALRRRPAHATAIAAAGFVAANLHGVHLGRALVAACVLAAASALVWAARHSQRRSVLVVGAVGATLLGVGAGVALHDRYLERRWTADLPRWPAYEAGDAASGVAVGVTGFPQSYPFFGAGLDNRVVALGDDGRGDELLPHRSCHGWWDDVLGAELDVVVVLDGGGLGGTDLGRWLVEEPTRWLRESGATPVLADRASVVYDVRAVTPACGPDRSTRETVAAPG